ncbi:hypothetical protein TNCT_738041 [Trichonephila clavata]|uniref:Uncharacterized protein n=1 Tax=Trichonephila clavata TaxID=2740835 RepID=A0A8X6K7A4_TRICU|nr:hypothetical protein TNCT_738041 [Trichonephila clavata]
MFDTEGNSNGYERRTGFIFLNSRQNYQGYMQVSESELVPHAPKLHGDGASNHAANTFDEQVLCEQYLKFWAF